MGDPVTVGALLLAATSTAYSAVSAQDAQAEQQRQADETKKQSDQKAADLQASDQKAAADQASTEAALQNRNQQRQRQKALQSSFSGRSGTILTSPLGVTGAPSTAGKTLLGA